MRKHAYLIIAHDNYSQLETLLKLLDDSRNDIYLHIDKKAPSYDPARFYDAVSASKLTMLEPICVYWGDYSVIECELMLLEAAASEGSYQYYHLLSGMDLPLKTQRQIHRFFDENDGKEFLRYGNHKLSNYAFRYKYRYRFIPRTANPHSRGFKLRVMLAALTQAALGVNRERNNPGVRFYKGTEWFSITDELARYTLEKRQWIRETFRDGYCCDEVFLHTLVRNSPFADRLYHPQCDSDCHANMVLIDWKRGSPYVFRTEDETQLLGSDLLFARKFDSRIDSTIIERISKAVLSALDVTADRRS